MKILDGSLENLPQPRPVRLALACCGCRKKPVWRSEVDRLAAREGNHRNEASAKTVLTQHDSLCIEVLRDRERSFEPVLIAGQAPSEQRTVIPGSWRQLSYLRTRARNLAMSRFAARASSPSSELKPCTPPG